ncbi:MAG: CD225/dispanin family protein [Verrucomicrobiae bacterium]|nr:CD225/dispanin family protein [Verrucomicrobiae bacterium]
MDWYYANNGQQAGPVSQEQLGELYRNGTVKPFDLVWNETMTEWTPIGKVDAFASAAPASPVLEPAPAQPAAAAPESESPPVLAAAVAPSPAVSGQAEPPTYLWQSIVVMLLCCLPLGIPALVFSTKVKPAYLSGDYNAALEASKKAKLFCILALVIGFVVQAIYIAINVFVVMGEMSK